MNTHKKDMGSYNRYKRRVCAEEGKGLSFVKRREERGMQVYRETVEKEVYQTLEVTSNSTSVFCRKEG